MNMYAYCKCNPISYADENGNMPSWAIKVCIGIGVIALSGIVAVATMGTSLACNGLTMLYGAVTGALIGAASGAVFGALLGAAMEGLRTGTLEGALRGAKKGAVNGAADGFMWGAIGGAVSGAINGRFCFVAGTLVMTKEGYKAIEKIEEGEEVLSYNENLGIFEYKEVVEVYKNETKELSHIKTKKDEIVSTPGHSILTSEGWKKAKDIKVNDLIKTKEGYERVIEVDSEELEEVENVYNLNVLGYHTYVVGYGLLVVHNSCKKSDLNFDSVDEAIKHADDTLGPNSTIVNKNGVEFHVSADGKWTWRFDQHTNGKLKYQKPHINLERWKNSFLDGGRNKILENIHLLW